jgi:CSLREA domain-containing protein
MTALRYTLILVLIFLPASPFATTFPVTKTADTNGSCTPGNCSLREAINGANANPGADDVPVPAGTYLLTLGQLVVSDDVDIAGVGQTSTIIDGNNTDRVFEIQSGLVEISGVTIQNGYVFAYGGGIRSYGSLSLIDSTVTGNTAMTAGYNWGRGGGISDRNGDLTLTRSTVSGNTADREGGGIFSFTGTLALTDSTVSGNTTETGGGGIATYSYNASLTNSTVSGNTADGRGGGIMSSGTLTLASSTVSGNDAAVGGGIDNRRTLTLTNSTVSENRALTGSGGGILNHGSGADGWPHPSYHATLINSTVSGNTSDFSGGGIHTSSYLTVTNSTVSGNSTRKGGGIFSSGLNNVNMTLTNSTISGNYASETGGGIHNDGLNSWTYITNSTVSGNNAGGAGGGVYSGDINGATLTNSTVSGNNAGGAGGGVYSYGSQTYADFINSTVSENYAGGAGAGIFDNSNLGSYFNNTIVAGNNGDNCDPNFTSTNSFGHNLTDDTTCGFAGPGDLVVADALLYPLGNFGGPTKTHHPMTGSPAIDAANNADCPATDQRGEARPFDGDDPPDGFSDCDIGSVEYLPEPHHAATLIAGATLLTLLYRRRVQASPQ